MEKFVDSRSRNAVIKRMIELGLIAERAEILPSKRKKSNKSQPSQASGYETSDSDSDSESDDGNSLDTRKVKVTVKTARNSTKSKNKSNSKSAPVRKLNEIQINIADVQRQMLEIDDNLKVNFAWLQESLNDAAEDADDQDDNDDPSDGVPLVPFLSAQKEALENQQFKRLLLALGLQEPQKEMVSLIDSNYLFSDLFIELFRFEF